MDTKTKIREVLKEHYGEFYTFLEIEYETKIIEKLHIGNIQTKQAWATYNQVILELKNNLNNSLKVKELQYQLTENSDPNIECIRLIEELETTTPELNRLYSKIKNL